MSPDAPSGYRLGYRADIEGLRAIAILLVVAAHARVSWLAGGFVGVDVFFVLSGYLITGLLVQEIQQTGDLRFARFYARRLRRLLPALLLMLFVVSILGWLLLPMAEQFRQADAAGNSAAWLSNFFFAFSNLGYFSPDAKSNLFLHTWSLGVEEQFYLVWPLLVVLAAGAWQGLRKAPRPARLKIVMPIIFVASLALCVVWSYRMPRMGFYMMPSRAWQFALGALVFMYFGAPRTGHDPRVRLGRHRLTAVAAGWSGLLLILASAVIIDGRMTYPGAWALLPSFGAAAILASGTLASTASAARLLSLRPLQAIGRVSYAWYLWHWPILLLGAIVLDIHNGWNQLGLVALSLALATISYRFVEKPIRRAKILMKRPRLAVAGGLAIMALAVAFAVGWHQDIRSQLLSPAQRRYSAAQWNSPIIYGKGCDDWYHSAKLVVCSFGPVDAAHTAVALGDSVALQWFPAIRKIFSRPGWRLKVITKSACPMVAKPIFYPRIGREYTECSKWRKRALKRIATINPDIVIVGSAYDYHYSKQQWISGTRAILKQLSADAQRVYLMRPTPILPFNGLACLAPRSWLYRWLKAAKCTSPAHSPRFNRVYAWLQDAARPFPDVKLIDMTGAVCPHDQCRAQINGMIVFRDNQHMTATFAKSLAPELAKRLAPGLRTISK